MYERVTSKKKSCQSIYHVTRGYLTRSSMRHDTWHDSFIHVMCLTWLFHTRHMAIWLVHAWDMTSALLVYALDLTWLLYESVMSTYASLFHTHDSFIHGICFRWLFHTCHVAIWLVHAWDMTHSHIQMRIGWHRILRLFLKLNQSFRNDLVPGVPGFHEIYSSYLLVPWY